MLLLLFLLLLLLLTHNVNRLWPACTQVFVGWLVGCLTSQQHASVSQGRICSDNFTCCHTEIEVADPTFYLTQSQYTDTEPTSPCTDPKTPGAWQGSHWTAIFLSHWYDSTRKIPSQAGFEPRIFRSRGGCLNHEVVCTQSNSLWRPIINHKASATLFTSMIAFFHRVWFVHDWVHTVETENPILAVQLTIQS